MKRVLSLDQQSKDLSARMRADMRNTIEQHLGFDQGLHEAMLDELVGDGMAPVEFLLIENDDLVMQLAEAITARHR